MKTLLTMNFILLFVALFGQRPTNITGTVIDENGKPVINGMIRYGHWIEDTAYTDKQGHFHVNYPNSQEHRYYFYFDTEGFLPKSFFGDLSNDDIKLKTPISLRSRKGFWYDPKQIDSTHLGITVKEAIKKYKLDIDMCLLLGDPPGKYCYFQTELSDSSYAYFIFQGIFTREKMANMNDVLERKITGIGISFIDSTEKSWGNGFTSENPYLVERRINAPK
jgi:hypothetical protein